MSTLSSLYRARFQPHLSKPVDVASLVAFRVLFGALLLWEVLRYFDHGWIHRQYIEPEFQFHYYGFGWLSPWPGAGMYVHFAGLGLLAVCILVGVFYRLAAALFFLGFTYVFLLDQANYLNHFYLVSLLSLLLVFLPAHRAASLDAWRRPSLRSDVVPAWTVWLLRAQLALVYAGAGVAKLNHDWLQGEPVRAWLDEAAVDALLGKLLVQEWFVLVVVYGGLLFDLLVAPGLLWKRTRPLFLVLAAGFHLANARLFDIGIFPWLALAATLVFLPPDWPRRVLNWPRRGIEAVPGPTRARVAALAGAFLALQFLVPLRHLLYPGNVHWTEEGHRFSWHMKLRDKELDEAVFEARAADGSVTVLDPRDCLTKCQAEKMVLTPDMILQYGHHVAEELRREGKGDVEVRARVRVSLNGREPQLMIDPAVDLAAEPRSLAPARWILPLETPLHGRPMGQRTESRE